MGWWSSKSESFSIDDVLGMKDRDIEKLLKEKKAPVRTAKELRKMAKDDRRRLEGEKGFAAFRAAVTEKGGSGNRNYKNVPLKERVHPSQYKKLEQSGRLGRPGTSFAQAAELKRTNPKEYERLLEQEARRQGLI
jgi:hypothetical protein